MPHGTATLRMARLAFTRCAQGSGSRTTACRSCVRPLDVKSVSVIQDSLARTTICGLGVVKVFRSEGLGPGSNAPIARHTQHVQVRRLELLSETPPPDTTASASHTCNLPGPGRGVAKSTLALLHSRRASILLHTTAKSDSFPQARRCRYPSPRFRVQVSFVGPRQRNETRSALAIPRPARQSHRLPAESCS